MPNVTVILNHYKEYMENHEFAESDTSLFTVWMLLHAVQTSLFTVWTF